LEGSLKAIDTSSDSDVKTHIVPAACGFYIEEKPGAGTAAMLETYGITKIGRLSYSGGRYAFDAQDVTGPGCATVGGIHAGRTCSFRLLLRRDMMELYLNDLLVQTFHVTPVTSGRVGFIVQDGTAVLDDLKAWEMDLAK
jgi:hypothetical protein